MTSAPIPINELEREAIEGADRAYRLPRFMQPRQSKPQHGSDDPELWRWAIQGDKAH